MSGYKRATVSISQEEYDRLRDAEEKLKKLPEPQIETRIIIQQESAQSLQANIDQVQQRQEHFHQVIAGLGHHIREIEASTQQALYQTEAQLIAAAQGYAGQLEQHIAGVLDQQDRYFHGVLQANHQQNLAHLAQLEQQQRQFQHNEQRKQQIAAQWLESAGEMFHFIDQQYAHNFFMPGYLSEIEQRLAQAGQNFSLGLSEAVIAASQALYLECSKTRLELERCHAEWFMLMQSAWEAVNQLVGLAASCRVVTAVDLDGNPLDSEIDTNYWSEGQLEPLILRLCDIRSGLEQAQNSPTTADLRQLLAQELPAYQASLEETVMQARINALNAQLRVNIADLVVRALQDQGFALAGFSFDQQDMRQGFGARLSNIEGSQVILQVSPAGDQVGENELQLQSMDLQQRTEHELRQRWHEVSRSLNTYGIAVGQFQQSPPASTRLQPAPVHARRGAPQQPHMLRPR